MRMKIKPPPKKSPKQDAWGSGFQEKLLNFSLRFGAKLTISPEISKFLVENLY